MTKAGHFITGFGAGVLLGYDPVFSALGSLAPDLDIFVAKLFGTWRSGVKKRLLTAHRGITHHAVLIPLFLFLSLLMEGNPLLFFAGSFLVGYVVHLVGDMMTPLGIPYGFGYNPRASLSLFETNSWREVFFLLAFMFLCGYKMFTENFVSQFLRPYAELIAWFFSLQPPLSFPP